MLISVTVRPKPKKKVSIVTTTPELETALTVILIVTLVPRPFLYGRGEKGEGRKGLVNNSTPTRIHGCIPAVSVDEGKRGCQVGVSRE